MEQGKADHRPRLCPPANADQIVLNKAVSKCSTIDVIQVVVFLLFRQLFLLQLFFHANDFRVCGAQPPLPCTCQTCINSGKLCLCMESRTDPLSPFRKGLCVIYEPGEGARNAGVPNEGTASNPEDEVNSELIPGTAEPPWSLGGADPGSFRCKGVFVHGSGFSSPC